MSEDRVAVLEQRMAALEREVAALRNGGRTISGQPFVSTNPNDPLDGHPLIAKKRSPEESAAYEARRLKELGLEGIEYIDPPKLRQLLIDDGVDPTTNEFSRGIIEMREE
jgi:hypothetical protein